MTFVNTLINSPEDVTERVNRRDEFIQLGILPVMEVSTREVTNLAHDVVACMMTIVFTTFVLFCRLFCF